MKSEKAEFAQRTLEKFKNHIQRPTKQEMYSLLQKGFPTGSSVFGSPEHVYDIDYCILSEDPPQAFEFWVREQQKAFYVQGHYRDHGFLSIYMIFGNKKNPTLYNLLFMVEKEFHVWKLATKWMKKYVKRLKDPEVITHNKDARVVQFEDLKEQARDYIKNEFR